MRPITPRCSCVPRPLRPMKPTAWESSTITSASYLSARSQMPARLAIVPSIEKTPSVAISRKRAPLAAFSLRLQVGHVVVLVAEALRLAEADAVDDAGVVQLVGDDRVLRAEQRFEQPAVGVEARAVEDRVVGAEELAELRFELLVDCLRAADEPHATRARSPIVRAPRARRRDHFRMLREAEVVVRAEIEHVAAAGDADVRAPCGDVMTRSGL